MCTYEAKARRERRTSLSRAGSDASSRASRQNSLTHSLSNPNRTQAHHNPETPNPKLTPTFVQVKAKYTASIPNRPTLLPHFPNPTLQSPTPPTLMPLIHIPIGPNLTRKSHGIATLTCMGCVRARTGRVMACQGALGASVASEAACICAWCCCRGLRERVGGRCWGYRVGCVLLLLG